MSFAGQLETYLNVRGGDDVIDAVRRCWASLWTGRAIGYRQRQGTRPEDVSMAVVVQQLVAAEVAGVVFTANPVTGVSIRGIGASPGRVTGPACVIHGPDEFDQMKPGDILVANITTPAWTPLFAMASGIVTDVGGPLSHSSIVAREYGVPAVLGTGVATHRIRSGQRITVDGDGGVVTLSG
jgi:phosphoenolpyruvate synthase/pyruvate phosphate dikinase